MTPAQSYEPTTNYQRPPEHPFDMAALSLAFLDVFAFLAVLVLPVSVAAVDWTVVAALPIQWTTAERPCGERRCQSGTPGPPAVFS